MRFLFLFLVIMVCTYAEAQDISVIRNHITENLVDGNYNEITDDIQKALNNTKKLKIIPFTPYEMIALNLLARNYRALLNIDTIKYWLSDEYKRRVVVQRDALNINIVELMKGYSQSSDFSLAIKNETPGNKTVLSIIAMELDTTSQKDINQYIRNNASQIKDRELREFFIDKFYIKYGPSPTAWGMDFGIGQAHFIQGAENLLRDKVGVDMDLYYRTPSIYYELQMNITNAKSKHDFEQNGYVYPKESGPQILRFAGNIGIPLELKKFIRIIPFIGLGVSTFGIAEKQKNDFNIKRDLEGEHFSIQGGLILDFLPLSIRSFGPGTVTQMGLRMRTFYTTIKEPSISNLDGGSISWSIGVFMYFSKIRRIKYEDGQ